MKVDMERVLREYLEQHPKRTVIVKTEVIGPTHYIVRMEDGKEVPVYPGTMFPE